MVLTDIAAECSLYHILATSFISIDIKSIFGIRANPSMWEEQWFNYAMLV